MFKIKFLNNKNEYTDYIRKPSFLKAKREVEKLIQKNIFEEKDLACIIIYEECLGESVQKRIFYPHALK